MSVHCRRQIVVLMRFAKINQAATRVAVRLGIHWMHSDDARMWMNVTFIVDRCDKMNSFGYNWIHILNSCVNRCAPAIRIVWTQSVRIIADAKMAFENRTETTIKFVLTWMNALRCRECASRDVSIIGAPTGVLVRPDSDWAIITELAKVVRWTMQTKIRLYSSWSFLILIPFFAYIRRSI